MSSTANFSITDLDNIGCHKMADWKHVREFF